MIPNYRKCNRERSALIFENLQFDLENAGQGQSALRHQIRLATAYNSRYCYAYRIPYRFRVTSDFLFHICDFFKCDLQNWVKVKL
jgi:hypothetical protein